MARRGRIAMLVVMVVTQVAAGMVFGSLCNERCPDESAQRSCPPFCSFCSTCVNAQQAVVKTFGAGVTAPASVVPNVFAPPQSAAPSPFAADIFHIPLLG